MAKCNCCGRTLTNGKDVYVKIKSYSPDENSDKVTLCGACLVTRILTISGNILVEEEDRIDEILQNEYNDLLSK